VPDMMRAARYHGPDEGLRVEDVPVPELGPLDVLVRVEACGICLSDVHLLDGTLPPEHVPITPGHEAFGTIAALGTDVDGWAVGDRAAIMGGRNCGLCERCRTGRLEECLAPKVMGFGYDGAWAEYVAVRFYSLSPVPAGVPAEQAAILADAVATPFAALLDRAGLRAGETVGLWGIGGLGAHAVQLALLMGAGLVIAVDPKPAARERALKLGADLALDPADPAFADEVRTATGGLGLDVAVDLVGMNRVLQQAETVLARGGRKLIVGLSAEPIELGPSVIFGFQNTSLLGHLGYAKRHLDTLVRLLERGRLDLSSSISDVIALDDVADGVARLASGTEDVVRIVVRP
jgi:D-arabinose 1-dehydrogenase-like Zn-dependent alcohol dehydrogenase